MLEGAVSAPTRSAKCPSCGAPIELKLGSSAAIICPYCRFCVARTGEVLEAIGKVADLVPTAPRLTVGDAGSVEGRPFTVGGRLQLDHGSGPWDEWYVELEPGRWAWLAYAQGRSYITYPQERFDAPPYESLRPGELCKLPGYSLDWTVTEIGQSRLVSAEGELPLPVVPGERSRYVDLTGPNGLFATIDYGASEADAPHIYVGRDVPEGGLVLTKKAIGPRPEQRVDVERLRCPSCGGPIKLFVADSERATCPSCRAVLDVAHGTLSAVGQLEARRQALTIPLGTAGTLCDEDVLVIGFVERTTTDGYAWNEYLLHTERGYRWLVEDNRHYTYVREISPSEARQGVFGATYKGRSFKRFQTSRAKITYVIGELYWKAEVGDSAALEDFIRPPEMLSKEESHNELHWSLGTYVPAREVWRGLKLAGSPLYTTEVGTCQPNPVRLGYMAAVAAVLVAILLVLGVMLEGGSGRTVARLPLKLLAAGHVAQPDENVVYSERFEITGSPQTLEVALDTNVSNAWVSVAGALIDDDTNEVRELYINAEEWHGVTDGESWQEGGPSTSEYLGRVPAGRYVMRFEGQWGRESTLAGYEPDPTATVEVRVGKRSIGTFFVALLLLVAPLLFAVVRKITFESRRWSNSNLSQGD